MSRGEKREMKQFSMKISEDLLGASRIAADCDGLPLARWIKDSMERSIGMSGFEIKKKIVQEGGSRIFKNWNAVSGITEEEFLEALEWVCDDPNADDGLLTREIGLLVTQDAERKAFMLDPNVNELAKKAYGGEWDESKTRGCIIKLKRVYSGPERQCGFYFFDEKEAAKAKEFGKSCGMWGRWTGNVSLSARDSI